MCERRLIDRSINLVLLIPMSLIYEGKIFVICMSILLNIIDIFFLWNSIFVHTFEILQLNGKKKSQSLTYVY